MAVERQPSTWSQEQLREWALEDKLYTEMMEQHHKEWYAIVQGKLYRSPDRAEVVRMLAESGVDARGALIDFMPHGPPYRV